MAQKAATTKKAVKKPAAKAKPAAAAKPAAKRVAKKGVTKGQALECQVCGLAVVVEEVGDIAVAQENILLCCDEPMKPKAAKAKAKAAPKATKKAKTAKK